MEFIELKPKDNKKSILAICNRNNKVIIDVMLALNQAEVNKETYEGVYTNLEYILDEIANSKEIYEVVLTNVGRSFVARSGIGLD
ncbi:hypothetical protein [Desulfitobacterium sp. AusDCA]|uniref:hypothetical protein n=1 Tax=Desulfitobacterium sp. AusDCA TaxID=3240383 RepID=UPI003DA6FAF1